MFLLLLNIPINNILLFGSKYLYHGCLPLDDHETNEIHPLAPLLQELCITNFDGYNLRPDKNAMCMNLIVEDDWHSLKCCCNSKSSSLVRGSILRLESVIESTNSKQTRSNNKKLLLHDQFEGSAHQFIYCAIAHQI